MTSKRSADALRAGTPVDVRSRFVGDWSRGFEVAERVEDQGYRVRRLSDDTVLPDVFDDQDVRPQRRRQDFWWH
ncbi:MAG TPA: hypothetical protein DCQ30_14140 [Acidimicrobiaceae bacterium]|nr:hypothetical protein [Acidimicrobiaceae bacterium]